MRVEYYRAKDTGRNAGAVVVVVGQWPPRVLDHRGLTAGRRIWGREATPAEVEDMSASTRCRCWTYENIEQLLADERQILEGHPEAIANLIRVLPPN